MSSVNDLEPQNSDGRITYRIVFSDCSKGLGIKVIGGISNKHREPGFGIFIKRILPRGRAAEDGRLQEGDQILSINGESAKHITNERAVTLLRKASATNYINLVISRDELARLEYNELLENNGFLSSANSIADQHSVSSRASTPSYHHCSLSPGAVDRLSPGSSRSHSPGSSHSTESYSRELAREGELSVNDCDVSTASLHESSQHDAPPDAMQHNEPLVVVIERSPLQHQTSSFNTPLKLAYPSASVIIPKVHNSDAAVTNALLSQCRTDVYLTPNCASTPQTMISASHHIDGSSNQNAVNALPTGAKYQLSPVPLATSSDEQHQFSDESNEVSSESNMASSPSRSPHVNKKLSLDPHVRLRVEKLQVALRYLGLEPDESQNKELYDRLNIDENDTVEYGEFVQAAREIFKFQLEHKNISPSASFIPSSSLSPTYKLRSGNNNVSPDENPNQVRRERDELRREVERLKTQLRDRELTCNSVEDELLRIRREAQGAIEESRALRSKVHLAEQAQHAARCMEQDYEEVVKLLENELAEVRMQASKAMENPAVQKRFAVLNSQLKKAETSRKTYEVATEKLLQFAEHVHSVLTGQEDTLAPRQDSKGDSGKAGRPPTYLGKHKRPANLATEARDVVKSVKSLVEVEPLPFGWDEAYTEDGIRYYINHVTQTTQWTHPLSNVDHKTELKTSRNGPKKQTIAPADSKHKSRDPDGATSATHVVTLH